MKAFCYLISVALASTSMLAVACNSSEASKAKVETEAVTMAEANTGATAQQPAQGNTGATAQQPAQANTEAAAEQPAESRTEAAAEKVHKGVTEFKSGVDMQIGKGKPVLVDLYATWCGPCRSYSPIFHRAADKYSGNALFFSVDVDKYPQLAQKYGVNSIPTTLVYDAKGDVKIYTGLLTPEQLDQIISSVIK